MTRLLTRETIGVGVAGTGFIGPVHVEGLRRNGINVLGLFGSTLEKSQQKAAEFGIPRNYASFDEMLADDDIDIVHLATPNHLHPEQTEAHVLAGCELAALYHVATVCVTRSGAATTATILEGFKRVKEGTPLAASNSDAVSGNYQARNVFRPVRKQDRQKKPFGSQPWKN